MLKLPAFCLCACMLFQAARRLPCVLPPHPRASTAGCAAVQPRHALGELGAACVTLAACAPGAPGGLSQGMPAAPGSINLLVQPWAHTD